MAPIQNDKWQPKSDSVKQLMENDVSSFQNAAVALLGITANIMEHPSDAKYRKILLADKNVESKLLPAQGAMSCLFEMGFIENGDCLTLPFETSITAVKHIHEQITLACKDMSEKERKSNENAKHPARATVPVNVNRTKVGEAKFIAKLHTSYNHVLMYENKRLQKVALSHIPLDKLESKAIGMMGNGVTITETNRKLKQDFLLLALLDWFKNCFFIWIDSPVCCHCGMSKCKLVGSVDPLPSELKWDGNRVELHRCTECHGTTRYPRYNHPEKLLETRSGRCGEWANCFTLLCVALGFDSRYVLDWTDHVWTEVYSEEQGRWLHCDPCENACDKPLLYEQGWGKKLTYVIAFSKDDIQDVTWRYSKNHADTLSRRFECRENWLVDTIMKLRNSRMVHCSPGRRDVLMRRLVYEIVELMMAKSTNEKLSGRTTGSVAWREARGEAGCTTTPSSSYVFSLTNSETNSKTFHLCYSSSQDVYVRLTDDDNKTNGWKSCVFESENMMKKVENDWKMTYLARTENSTTASITWNFDFAGSRLVVDRIVIHVTNACYENGVVHWLLCTDDKCVPLTGNNYQTINDLRGSTTFKLSAHLRGGKGDNAWQHTQLFRQSLDATDYPFDVKIFFRSEE